MTYRIDTVEGRTRLKPRTPPYWKKLTTGCHVGYRKSAGGDGTWLAQAYDSSTQKQTRQSYGKLDHIPAHQQFDAAKKMAEAWFEHLGRGGSTKVITVGSACERYVQRLIDAGETKNAEDLRARFRRRVYSHKIADQALTKLNRKTVEEWRNQLAKTPVKTNPYSDPSLTRERSSSSLNRDMAALRAALNSAHDNGDVTNDMAWRVALRAIENAGTRRDTYLDRAQRSALIDSSDASLGQLLRCMSLLPLRPGALAALTVENVNTQLGVLTVGKDKAGRDRKIKLPPTTAAVIAGLTKDKLPSAPLLSQADGQAWHKDAWKRPVKAAAAAAGLPNTVTAYTLRHSVITDLVTNGLDLLTVAQLSGTSVAMIEKHYGHHRAEHAAKALAGLAL